MKNLLKETNQFFERNGLNWEDVEWIENEGMEIPIEKFKEVASHTYYDSGCGSQVISPSLHIVGKHWVMFREEYDGAEWWRIVKTIRPTRECKIVHIGTRG
jgi:hypothetical protein